MNKFLKKFLILFALFGLLFPFSVKAVSLLGMTRGILDLLGQFLLAFAIIAFAIIFISYTALSFASLAIIVFSWVMRITTEVPIVDSWARDIGWTFTRNFVNMLFIIILAWIGIATILRLREYQTGKIFLKLLVIALLVNFSPVLVGLVVDASNIIIGYFVSGITQGNVLECILVPCDVGGGRYTGGFIQVAGEGLWSAFSTAFALTTNAQDRLLALGTVAGYGIFFFVVTCVFALLALLYLFRIIAFWVLLILAPIAFICYILPQTERFWRMWWHQLLQWAFVGVIAIFFVWLAFALLQATAENPMVRGMFGTFPDADLNTEGVQGCPDPANCPPNAQAPAPATCQVANPPPECYCDALACQLQRIEGVDIQSNRRYSAFSGFFIQALNALMPLAVVVVFLAIGLFFGFTSSAMGASAIVGWGEKKGKAKWKEWRERGKRKGREELRKRMPEKVRKRMEEWATTPPPERGGVVARGGGWMKRRIGEITIGLTEAEIEDIKRKEGEMKGKILERKMAELGKVKTFAEKIGVFRAITEDAELDDFRKRLKAQGWDDKKIDDYVTKMGQEAAKIHPDMAKKIIKAAPRLAPEVAAGLSPELREKAGLIMRPEDIEKYFTKEEREKFSPEELQKFGITRKITAESSPADIAKMDWSGLSAVLKEAKRKPPELRTEREKLALESEEAMHRFWSGREIGAAAREFGKEFVDIFMEEAKRRGADWYGLRNQKVLKYLRTSPAEELGLEMPGGKTLSEEEIGELRKKEVTPKIIVTEEKARRKKIVKYPPPEEERKEKEEMRREKEEA